jgi:hypothetical protein
MGKMVPRHAQYGHRVADLLAVPPRDLNVHNGLNTNPSSN